jgi:nitrogen fixation/metabolism regulation signal transduction histidine kinase
MIDEEQLRGVFVNLIENSIEAFDESQKEKQVFIKTFHDAARDLIVAEVSDNGSGISPAGFQKLSSLIFLPKDAEQVWDWQSCRGSSASIEGK